MTDLVVSVRLKADGSGLVGQVGEVKAAIVDLGQAARGSSAPTRELETATDALASAQGQAAGGAREAAAAQQAGVSSAKQLETATEALAAAQVQATGGAQQAAGAQQAGVAAARQLETATEALAAAQVQAGAGSREAAAAQQAGVIAARQLETATKTLSVTQTTATASAGQMRAGSMMLGQQIQDVGMQLALGTDFMRVFAMQAGQTALAVQQMTGGSSRLATFIGGPFGSALLAGVSVAALLGSELLSTADAAKTAELASDGLSDAQGVLGRMFDLVSGKLERQNELLRLNAQLMAYNLRIEADAARQRAQERIDDTRLSIGKMGAIGYLGASADPSAGAASLAAGRAAQERVQGALRGVLAGNLDASKIFDAVRDSDLKQLNITREDFVTALRDAVEARFKGQTADDILKSLASGTLVQDLRRDAPDRKPRDTRAATERLGEFGRDAADRIAGITGRFAGQPKLIEQAAAASLR